MEKEEVKEKEKVDEVEEVEEETEEVKPKSKFVRVIINTFIFIILLVVGLIVYAKYVGTEGLVVKEYRVESDILTTNFSGLKIVHFSDLLYKTTIDKDDVKELVERINELKPDIVVFTGDLTGSRKLTDNDKSFLIEQLSSINTTIGAYAVYGDHDYKNQNFEEIMTSSSFTILNNAYDAIYNNTNDPMYIVGLSCVSKENVNLEQAFSFYNEENRPYIIVLAHDGKTVKSIDESNYETDMILLGHSLGGSVKIPGLENILIDDNAYKYYDAYYKKGITNIYVSSGLGTDEYEYRLFNKPSFNLYRLKAK
jgi:predicted MPP superfamily phosphohydrolase